jgi:hypothetical protein
MPLDEPVEPTATVVPAAAGPDDVWRAGAEAIEAEDLSQGVEALGLDNPDPSAPPAVEPEVEPEGGPTELPPEEEPVAAAPVEGAPVAVVEPVEGEAPAEPAPVEEPPKNIMIPKERLDQETQRRRAAENRLEQIQKGVQQGDTPTDTQRQLEEMDIDLGDSPKQMFDTLLDGNLDQANELFSSMLKKAAQSAAQTGYEQARNDMGSVVDSSNQKSAEQLVILDLEASHGFFRPGDDSYDNAAVQDTVAMQEGFIGQGYTRADAMQKAADYTLKMRAVTHPDQVVTAPVAPAPAAAPAATPAEVKRNVDAATQQPPSVSTGRSNPVISDLPDISTLSMEEIDALPEATMRRLRGDYV